MINSIISNKDRDVWVFYSISILKFWDSGFGANAEANKYVDIFVSGSKLRIIFLTDQLYEVGLYDYIVNKELFISIDENFTKV